jgi:adenylyltransferase/sulfurtransferase
MLEKEVLSNEEWQRYARHLALPNFGPAQQQQLKQAKVLVIGAGGLGAPLLLYLAAAGVGHIGIVDFDVVDTSNLQRQILYTVADVGRLKAEAASDRLLAMNPYLDITVHAFALLRDNALDLISQYDIIADGTDNFPTRFLVNDACVLLGKVNVYASIFRYEGQVSVFNYPMPDGRRGPNYRNLHAFPPDPGSVPSCAEGGVLGVLPGIIGSMQASEVIKIITGIGEPLAGRLFLFDAASFSARTIKLNWSVSVEISELPLDDLSCLPTPAKVPTLTLATFQQWQQQNKDFQLIDVREPHEYALQNLGGQLIPLGQILAEAHQIALDKPVIIHCQTGKRSAEAIRQLQEKFAWGHLWNLEYWS